MGYFALPTFHSSTILWVSLIIGTKCVEEVLGCPTVCGCTKLDVNCEGKNLTSFPTAIPLMSKELFLAHNNISNLPFLTMSYLNELVYLDCSHNLITMDLDFSFPGLPKLMYLDLSFNRLSLITPFTFSQLNRLLLLNLSGNPMMREIKEYSFERNTFLRYLDVSDCGLAYLSAETFKALYSLRVFGIKGNPWTCDCKLLSLLKWLKSAGIESPDSENIICKKPEIFQDNSITVVEPKLHYLCLLKFETEDFIYMVLIAFCIFFGGTLVAWLIGFGTVIYHHPIMKCKASQRMKNTE